MEEAVFIRKMVKNLAGIDFISIPNTQETIREYLHQNTEELFRFSYFWDKFRLQWEQIEPNRVYEYMFLNVLHYLVCLDDSCDRLLILGPVLTNPFTEDNIPPFLTQHGFSLQAGKYLLTYCQQLPVIPPHILYKVSDLIFRQLTGAEIPLQVVQSQLQPEFQKTLTFALTDRHEEVTQMRQVEHRYEMSSVLSEAVKQGNLSLAQSLLNSWNPRKDQIARNANPLRNSQNYCIVMNTQLRLALEGIGIHPYRLDYLSNEIGLKIERIKSEKELPTLANDIVIQYCRLVLEHKYPDISGVTRLAVIYIKDHLSENLTVKELADVLSVNADYLSHQFRKEMGLTCISFLNRERVRQAAAMLRNTQLQIQQIALLVGYNNTSYFARQFRLYYHTTPLSYRNKATH